MSDAGARVLLSSAVRAFVESGGTLRYKAIRSDAGPHWRVYGVDPNGREREVILVRNGEPKIIRSANAVVSYHCEMVPNAREVCIPLPPED